MWSIITQMMNIPMTERIAYNQKDVSLKCPTLSSVSFQKPFAHRIVVGMYEKHSEDGCSTHIDVFIIWNIEILEIHECGNGSKNCQNLVAVSNKIIWRLVMACMAVDVAVCQNTQSGN